MKLARIGDVGAEKRAVLHDEKYYPVVSIAADIDAQFWDSGALARVGSDSRKVSHFAAVTMAQFSTVTDTRIPSVAQQASKPLAWTF